MSWTSSGGWDDSGVRRTGEDEKGYEDSSTLFPIWAGYAHSVGTLLNAPGSDDARMDDAGVGNDCLFWNTQGIVG